MSHARPSIVLTAPPPESFQRHRFGRATVDDVQSTIATHIAASALQVYPSAAIPVLTSASGATDNGRVIEWFGVDTEYNLIGAQATLAGLGTATLPETMLDVFRLKDRTDDAAFAGGDIVATIGAAEMSEIVAGRGQSQCARQWVPAGHTGYLQKLFFASEKKLEEATIWVWDIDGTWRAITDLGLGLSPSTGGDIQRVYESSTSWGIEVPGPTRLEARATQDLSAAGAVICEFTMLITPNDQRSNPDD